MTEIRDGRATLPQKWKTTFVCLDWLIYIPTISVLPSEEVRVYPFISGYYRDGVVRSDYEGFKDGTVVFVESDKAPALAFFQWGGAARSVLDYVREGDTPDAVLSEQEYAWFKTVVEGERERLMHMIPPSDPAYRRWEYCPTAIFPSTAPATLTRSETKQ
jgi:hypothetical protein